MIRYTLLLTCLLFCIGTIPVSAQETEEKKQLPNELGITKEYEDGFFNVRIESNKIKVTFLDKEKGIIPPPYPEATARYQYKLDPRGSTTFKPSYNVILTQSGDSLISDRVIRPPHNIFIYITLREKETSQRQEKDYQSVYGTGRREDKRKTKSLPRIHINQLPPPKEKAKDAVKTSSASSGKKYRFTKS